MVQFLAVLGLLLICYSLWSDRNKQVKRKEELLEYKKIHEDLLKARKDVQSLLDHMEKTSETIVEDITIRMAEIKELEKSLQEKALEQTVLKETVLEEKVSEEADLEETVHEDKTVKPLIEPKVMKTEYKTSKTIEFPTLKQNGSNYSGKANKNNIKSKKQIAKEATGIIEATPKQQMVYAMANLGYSEEEIAKNMNIGKGEVRLILELKRKGEKNNA